MRARRGHQAPGSSSRRISRLWPQAHVSSDSSFFAGLAETRTAEDQTTSAVGTVSGYDLAPFLKLNMKHAAAAIMLGFAAYLRPGEMLAIRKEDLSGPDALSETLVPPAASVKSGREVKSRSSRRDPWMGNVLNMLESRSSFLLDLTYFELVQVWHSAM